MLAPNPATSGSTARTDVFVDTLGTNIIYESSNCSTPFKRFFDKIFLFQKTGGVFPCFWLKGSKIGKMEKVFKKPLTALSRF